MTSQVEQTKHCDRPHGEKRSSHRQLYKRAQRFLPPSFGEPCAHCPPIGVSRPWWDELTLGTIRISEMNWNLTVGRLWIVSVTTSAHQCRVRGSPCRELRHSACRHEWLDDVDVCDRTGEIEVVHPLEVQPVLRRHAQGLTDAERSVRCNGSTPAEDVVDPAGRNANRSRQARCTDLQFVKDLRKMFSGVDRVVAHDTSSVVVRDFNLPGTTVRPAETDAPLIVDADAVLPRAVTVQRLEAVGRR